MIREVIIDPHYESKHSASVNDEIILSLVASLDGEEREPKETDDEGFEYFVTEPHFFLGKPYRLVWLLPQEGDYVGIINCYRRRYGKRR